MTNTGTIELVILQDQVMYNVGLTRHDLIGSLYPVDGDLLTIEEVERKGLALQNNGMLPASRFISSTTTYEKIARDSIRSFLFDHTGNSQTKAIHRLDALYRHGINTVKTQFTW